ncbi:MAG: toxin-activating lysine-acyltransferase, partial [Pseudomonadota bacterium]
MDPAVLEKIAQVRTKLHETFGKVVLAMKTVPRYRNLSVSELGTFVLDPLMRDRVAIASSAKEGAPVEGTLSGIAIWASVSEEVDAKIREQIKAGTFRVRLKPDDWTSGNINWLLDVVAPNQRLTTAVIANFRQVLPKASKQDGPKADGADSPSRDMRIHPIVTRLVEPDALEKIGAPNR